MSTHTPVTQQDGPVATTPAWHSRLALADAPPLSVMCALAALASTALNQVVVPALPGGTRHALYVPLGHAGRYAENLAVIAGITALLAGVFAAARAPAFGSLRRRLLSIVFLTVLLRAVVIATLFERDATTRENVYYAVGAAHVIAVFTGMAVFDRARSLLARLVAGFLIATPTVNLLTVTLELTTDLAVDPWTHNAHRWLSSSAEAAYLCLLLVSSYFVVPRALAPRAVAARMVGLIVLFTALLGLTYAHRKLGADFTLYLYRALRVDLLLERWPVAYALPVGAAAGAAFGALIAGGGRVQSGAGLLLLLAAGHSPTAPGRLLCMTLGFALLARAVASLDERADAPTEAPASA